ncbi:MAG: Na+/H+ antiporter subunit E [Actinomycetes bacterium]
MLRRLPFVAWIAVVWLALWGDVSWANLLGGLLVGAFLVVAVPLPASTTRYRGSLPAALRYTAVFLRDLVVATAEVARQVFWPVARLRPSIVEVPLSTRDPALLSLVANTITLTPGTMTLQVHEDTGLLFVHCLHLAEGADVEVVEQARGYERLGARALGIDVPSPSKEAPR